MTEVENVEAPQGEQWILDRISSLPVMATALDQLNSLYAKAKDNKLVAVTANATEAGFGLAYNMTKPVTGKFENQISFLNKAACNQLDKLEESFPIITKPTEEVVKATLDYGHQVVDPVVSKVTSVRDYGAEKVAEVKEQATKTLAFGGNVISDATNFTVGVTFGTANKVKEVVAATGSFGVATATSAKNYGVEKVVEAKQKVVEVISQGTESLGSAKNCVLEKLTETSANVGSTVMSKVDDRLVAYESYLDYYLPPEGEEGKEAKADDNAGLVHRILLVGDKTRNRINRKLLREVRSNCGSLKEAGMVQLENTKSYVFSVPEKLTAGMSFVKSSADGVASAASYEALSALSALVAAANGARDKAEGVYKHVQEGGVNLSTDFEKLLASGKEFGLKFVHNVKDGSEKVVSYAIRLPKDKFESVKDKVLFLWTEINKSEEEVLKEVLEDESANHSPESCTFEKKFIVTSRHLIQKSKDLTTPVLGLIQVSRKQLEEKVDSLKNNLPELHTEKVINSSYLQVSVLKPDFSKLLTDAYSGSLGLLKQLNDKLWDLTLNKLYVRDLEGTTARAVEEMPMVGIETENARSQPTFVANHEEIRNIDDVTTEEEEDEEQSEGQNGGKNDEEEQDDIEESDEEKDEGDEKEGDDEEEDDDIVESPSQ